MRAIHPLLQQVLLQKQLDRSPQQPGLRAALPQNNLYIVKMSARIQGDIAKKLPRKIIKTLPARIQQNRASRRGPACQSDAMRIENHAQAGQGLAEPRANLRHDVFRDGVIASASSRDNGVRFHGVPVTLARQALNARDAA